MSTGHHNVSPAVHRPSYYFHRHNILPTGIECGRPAKRPCIGAILAFRYGSFKIGLLAQFSSLPLARNLLLSLSKIFSEPYFLIFLGF